MFRWGGHRGRDCCIVVPIECPFGVLLVLVFSGLAVTRLLW